MKQLKAAQKASTVAESEEIKRALMAKWAAGFRCPHCRHLFDTAIVRKRHIEDGKCRALKESKYKGKQPKARKHYKHSYAAFLARGSKTSNE